MKKKKKKKKKTKTKEKKKKKEEAPQQKSAFFNRRELKYVKIKFIMILLDSFFFAGLKLNRIDPALVFNAYACKAEEEGDIWVRVAPPRNRVRTPL